LYLFQWIGHIRPYDESPASAQSERTVFDVAREIGSCEPCLDEIHGTENKTTQRHPLLPAPENAGFQKNKNKKRLKKSILSKLCQVLYQHLIDFIYGPGTIPIAFLLRTPVLCFFPPKYTNLTGKPRHARSSRYRHQKQTEIPVRKTKPETLETQE
jgi:hypothetical protein